MINVNNSVSMRNCKVKAIELRLKGRLTYFRRQNRRKSKKFIKYGKMLGISNPNSLVNSASNVGTNRFGLISARLWVLEHKRTKLKTLNKY